MIELRDYQKDIAKTALLHNTLVVLPTGLGKTAIAFYVIQRYKRALFLAPTKPLVEQHYRSFINNFSLDKVTIATGSVKNRDYENRFIFATPQTITSDFEILNKDHFDIVVFDEAHRAVGNYDYVQIAKYFNKARTIGLTASPGYKREKIMEIINNLRINRIEYRKEDDPQILKHLHIKKINPIFIDLPNKYKELIKDINDKAQIIKDELAKIFPNLKITKYNVEDISKYIEKLEEENKWKVWQEYSKLLTYLHLKELLEIQSIDAAIRYVSDLNFNGSRAQKSISQELYNLLTNYNLDTHPKIIKLLEIINKKNNKQGIVFSQYKAQIFHLSDILTSKTIAHEILIGKTSSRKKQFESIERFLRGEVNVLLSSSVGEEGLDLPGADYVVFYESIPSPIRVIQRMGRTARFREGEVYILIARDTYDEISYKLANKRINTMYRELNNIKNELERKAPNLFDQL